MYAGVNQNKARLTDVYQPKWQKLTRMVTIGHDRIKQAVAGENLAEDEGAMFDWTLSCLTLISKRVRIWGY
jgi:hypothetical protein